MRLLSAELVVLESRVYSRGARMNSVEMSKSSADAGIRIEAYGLGKATEITA